VRTVRRGGDYLRVADPAWADPLDGRFSARRGGRWNPPRSFAAVYLSRTVEVARAVVHQKLADHPYGPEDLSPATAPVLVEAVVRAERFADALTARGLGSAGLPPGYPRDEAGDVVGWARCQPIGVDAWEAGLPGVACRSAAPTAPPGGEELAWFQRGRRRLRARAVRRFDDWFWELGLGLSPPAR